MYCKICGATLTPGDVICKNCGASNSNANSEPMAPTAQPISNEPVIPNNNQVQPSVNNEPNIVEEMNPVEELPKKENDSKESSKHDDSAASKDGGKFLIVIGVIVGILATAVIGYLIYTSLKDKNKNEDNPNITVVTQTNYIVNYDGYKYNFNSNVELSIGDYLVMSKDKWIAKMYHDSTKEFSELTNDALNKSFEKITDYKVSNINQKTYGALSCFEAKVEYTDGAKTLLLLCNKQDGGYWHIEIGSGSYAEYPTSDIANEVVTYLSDAKKVEDSENKLKTAKIEFAADETNSTEQVSQ